MINFYKILNDQTTCNLGLDIVKEYIISNADKITYLSLPYYKKALIPTILSISTNKLTDNIIQIVITAKLYDFDWVDGLVLLELHENGSISSPSQFFVDMDDLSRNINMRLRKIRIKNWMMS